MVFGFSAVKNDGLVNARYNIGQCPSCGNQTHNRSRLGRMYPLNTPGIVNNGICLVCNPPDSISSVAVQELLDSFVFTPNSYSSTSHHSVPIAQSQQEESNVTHYERVNDYSHVDDYGGEDDTHHYDETTTVGKGTLTFPASEEMYVGDYTTVEDNDDQPKRIRHGKGINIYPNGSVYDGSWCHDKKHGSGVMTWHTSGGNEEKYVGEWKEDLFDGQGKIIICAGNVHVYDGSFLAGKMHGRGAYTSRDGSVTYDGDWKNGKMHGHGVFTVHNTSGVGDGSHDRGHDSAVAIYTGAFCDGMANGRGELAWPRSGATYVGEWRNDLRHGEGKHTFSNGSVYNGEWQDDKRHGHGEMTYIHAAEYVGEWRHHKRNGHGLMIYEDGPVYDGPWKDGRWIGE